MYFFAEIFKHCVFLCITEVEQNGRNRRKENFIGLRCKKYYSANQWKVDCTAMQQMTSCAWVVSRWVVKKVVYNDDNCSLFNFATSLYLIFGLFS